MRLPSGDRLSARRFRQLGHVLGMSDGAEVLHYIVELPFASPAFVHDVEQAMTFARNPIYAVLHEACWADGGATRWAAERLLPAEYGEQPELLMGEHIYPWLFDEIGGARPVARRRARARRARVAAALRPRAPGRQRGAGGRGDLRRGHVRRAPLQRGDGGAGPRAAAVGDQRVRAQRAARRRGAHPRPADRPRPRTA